MKIKVLVIDDSSLIRGIITAIVNEQRDMMVVGAAPDPIAARDMIRDLNPDVLTLDIEMPHMNGLSFLKRLMRARPTPVVMLSSHTQQGSDVAFRALALGAVDFVGKPVLGRDSDPEDYARSIVEAIRGAHAARDKVRPPEVVASPGVQPMLPELGDQFVAQGKVVVMGGSTGGAEALREVLPALPADCPPILVALHMPAAFTRHFARRLDELCKATVKVPEDGEPALPGHIYIAPGDAHMIVQRYGDRGFGIRLPESAPRPSLDLLFRSAAREAGPDAIGVILTGMGLDGAEGLLEMRLAGARTLAQDERSSIVFGMARAAIELDAVTEVVPLGQVARAVLAHLSQGAGDAGAAAVAAA
jgi:two-component system chemotaxis response regulator CheB